MIAHGMQPSGAATRPGDCAGFEQFPVQTAGYPSAVSPLTGTTPAAPQSAAGGFSGKLYTHSYSARARIAAARTITVPADEAAQMVRAYPRLSLAAIGHRFGYAPDVIRRTLVHAGVAIRPKGRPRIPAATQDRRP